MVRETNGAEARWKLLEKSFVPVSICRKPFQHSPDSRSHNWLWSVGRRFDL